MINQLALHGGTPIRKTLLPYGRQSIEADDIEAVVSVLQSDWLTTGPTVRKFEQAFAEFVGVKEAVAVSNGTAALHAAIAAIGLAAGDEVIVTPMTFAASANCILYCGGTPVFADVEPNTLLIDPVSIEAKITPKTKAIIAVDYAGHPCDYVALREIANRHNLVLVDDACHAIGGAHQGQSVGALADLNTFSLHPVKHITTGEGGMITTDNEAWAQTMRTFRNHGITTDHRQRAKTGSWFYEMVSEGYNYRITDFQCALGISQLRKLPQWIEQRQAIAEQYDVAFAEIDGVMPLYVRDDVSHAYHLYVVRFDMARLNVDKATLFAALRAEKIGVQVHYIPVHLHPFYRDNFGTAEGLCPVAEAAYNEIISLPMFPLMNEQDVEDVVAAVQKIVMAYS